MKKETATKTSQRKTLGPHHLRNVRDEHLLMVEKRTHFELQRVCHECPGHR